MLDIRGDKKCINVVQGTVITRNKSLCHRIFCHKRGKPYFHCGYTTTNCFMCDDEKKIFGMVKKIKKKFKTNFLTCKHH